MEETGGKVVYLAQFRQQAQAKRPGKDGAEHVHPQIKQALEDLLTDSESKPPVKAERKRPARAAQAGRVLHQSAQGIGNVQVAGDLIIQAPLAAKRALTPTLSPGDSELTNEQAAEIKRLVGVVVDSSGRPWSHVYAALNGRMEATSYLMIKRHRYSEAVAYLHKWIASVSAPPLRAENSEAQRKRFLKRIHAQARKQGGSMDSIHAYIRGRFGTPSLADLGPGQLQEVIREFRL